MKHTVSRKVRCPFYRHEDPQVIYCRGVVDDSVIHLAFADKITCKSYKELNCRNHWECCPVAEMLCTIREEDDLE